MKDIYNDLNVLNNDLITEYKIRCQNHSDLVESLKKVNIIIQRAANLRGNQLMDILLIVLLFDCLIVKHWNSG